MEFWFRAYTRYVQAQWAVFKVKVTAGTKEQFVLQLDTSVRMYLAFLCQQIVRNDCWTSLKELCIHMATLKAEFPTLVSPIGAILIELSKVNVSSASGLNTKSLNLGALNRLTSGALWQRYQVERAAGVFKAMKANLRTDAPDGRLAQVDKLLSHPSLRADHRAELELVRSCIDQDIPPTEQLQYLLAVQGRIQLLLHWIPDHAMGYLRYGIGGPENITSVEDFNKWVWPTLEQFSDEQIAGVPDHTKRTLLTDFECIKNKKTFLIRWIFYFCWHCVCVAPLPSLVWGC